MAEGLVGTSSAILTSRAAADAAALDGDGHDRRRRRVWWPDVLRQHREDPADVLPELVVAFAARGAAPVELAEALLSVWRCGYSSRLTDVLRIGGVVGILRSAGYRETRSARARIAHLRDVELLPGPGGASVVFERLHEARVTPERVLYRGSRADRGADGLSWTPSREVAARYASRRAGSLWSSSPSADAYLLGCGEWLGGRMSDLFGPIRTVPEYLIDPAGLDVQEVSV